MNAEEADPILDNPAALRALALAADRRLRRHAQHPLAEFSQRCQAYAAVATSLRLLAASLEPESLSGMGPGFKL